MSKSLSNHRIWSTVKIKSEGFDTLSKVTNPSKGHCPTRIQVTGSGARNMVMENETKQEKIVQCGSSRDEMSREDLKSATNEIGAHETKCQK